MLTVGTSGPELQSVWNTELWKVHFIVICFLATKTKSLKYEAELQVFFATHKEVTWDLVDPNEETSPTLPRGHLSGASWTLEAESVTLLVSSSSFWEA